MTRNIGKFVNFCFQVHQPYRLKWQGLDSSSPQKINDYYDHYFDIEENKRILKRVCEKCYDPSNKLILSLIEETRNSHNPFKVCFSISGVLLEQLSKWAPDTLDSFRKLASTGNVEFMGETYFHSLASLWDEERGEFKEQVKMHMRALHDFLGFDSPVTFRNTELLYNNGIARSVASLGFKSIFAEGVHHKLGWRSPNYVYKVPDNVGDIRVLLRNYRLSDDIGYRFGARWWDSWPLTADKYAEWLGIASGQVVNVYIDYETFGEHHWKDSGIFDFLSHLPGSVQAHNGLCFGTPSETVSHFNPVGVFDVFELATTSWADNERDTSAWLGNKMQVFAYNQLRKLEKKVKEKRDPELLRIWRLLQTSDHFYYMCTKSWGDGDVHCYFSPYSTPEDGFFNFMNILLDFKERLNQ